MIQQTSSLILTSNKAFDLVDGPQIGPMLKLEKEVKILQMKVKNLAEKQKMERSISEKIQLLRNQSEQAYDTLRKLSHEYNQKYNLYSSKIDNRSQDINDERDKLQSSVYYIEQQNIQLEKECKAKLEKKKQIEQQIQAYTQKRQRLRQQLDQQNSHLSRLIRSNKAAEENIRITREECQIYQEQIYQVDTKGQNLKKYGYQVVPPAIEKMIKEKESLIKTIEELEQKIFQQNKILNKLLRPQIAAELREDLRKKKQKKMELQSLIEKNALLKVENQRLSQIKYTYEWNPNSQIKQLELNLQQEQKKIDIIQKEISNIRRRATQANQKLKKYSHYVEIKKQTEEDTTLNAVELFDSPRKIKEKTKKDKGKKPARYTIFEQMKNDLELTNPKKVYWKDSLKLLTENETVPIDQFIYRVKKPSQKTAIVVMSVVLITAVFIYDWMSKK